MTIEEQLAQLNKITWIVMTEPDVNKKWHDINITNRLNTLYEDGYEIYVGDQEHCYSIGELRAIDRLIVWITQISYANEEIEDQIAMNEEYADTDKFEEMIEEAKEGLIAYRKLHPDAISFFIKSDWNKITLKYCPYHLFQELILHKAALIRH
jgi:Mg2+ and Co2+ transporter CorA